MNYRFLGRTGMKVSELCLGAMTFGRETDQPTSVQMMNDFAAAGGSFIDTANVYSTGGSETIVGEWLATQPRDQWVIATKVRFTMSDAPNDTGLSRKHILSSIDQSLRRLRTDYIDLYQVHGWDARTPLEETLATLDQLVKVGKVRYIGVSNYMAYQLQKAVDLSYARNWEAFVCLQPLYNLLDRAIEWEIVEICRNEGLGIIPWSPLRGGWLSGKYRRGMANPPGDSRVGEATREGWSERWDVYGNERTWQVLDVLFAVAAETGKSPAQVALNWVKDQPLVTAPIIGARTLAQFTDNLGAVGWTLTADQRERLDKASRLEGPYPYGEYATWGDRD